jgi:hypothetical protein
MKDTAEESADLKMALKHDPVTDELRAEAVTFPLEADDAYFEVKEGRDHLTPGSWVAEQLNQHERHTQT